jgi:hypothetical protein
MSPVYYGFLNMTTVTNGDELIVDRRLGERRPAFETRAQREGRPERRSPLPATWTRSDVIVVSPPNQLPAR